MVGEATGPHREIFDMMGLLQTSQNAKSQKAKTLGKNEQRNGAKAYPPKCALTTGDVVIDRMTPVENNFSAAC